MRGMCRGKQTARWVSGIASLFVVAFVAGSCHMADRSPTGPVTEKPILVSESAGQGAGGQGQAASGRGAFYPLEIGNEWTYKDRTTFRMELFGAGAAETLVYNSEEVHTLVGTEVLSGREYVVELQERTDLSTGDLYTQWVRYRQDQAGLYEADVPVSQPPAHQERLADLGTNGAGWRWRASWKQVCQEVEAEHGGAFEQAWAELTRKLDALENLGGLSAKHSPVQAGPPGGVMTGEITRLMYQLRPGQEWTVRDVPFFGSEVDRRDVLDLPPGKMSCSRIQMTNFALGPNDEVLVWYGRDGLVGMSISVETEMIDFGGNPIGLLIFEENMFLESVDLVRPGRF